MDRKTKVRAVLLWLQNPVYVLPGDDNGPEWFQDPARNILLLHVAGTPTDIRSRSPLPDLVTDRMIWNLRDLYQFMESPLTDTGERHPPLNEDEVLLVTDRDGNIQDPDGLHTGRIHVVRVGHRAFVTIDRIIREIYQIEHAPTR